MAVRCIACGRTLHDGSECPECGTGGEPPELSPEDAAIRARIAEARASLRKPEPRKAKP